MKKTRQTLQIGDTFYIEAPIRWLTTNILAGGIRKIETEQLDKVIGNELKVVNISGNIVSFDCVETNSTNNYVTIFEELERVGILDKVEEETKPSLSVGDIFKIEKDTFISYATKDNPKDWSNSQLNAGKYEIKKITKTRVYFNEEKALDSNWYLMKTKVFESIAVLDKPAEAPKTKTIIGYVFNEQFAEFKQAALKLASVSNFNIDDGTAFVTESKVEEYLKEAGVLDKWFTPVYEEDFKVGDWVVFQFYKAAPMYKTSVWNQNMTLQISVIESKGENLRFDGQHPRGDSTQLSNHVSCFRKATKEEIEEATTRKISNIGSKNATLILDKDGNTIRIAGKAERLFLNMLTTAYDNIRFSNIGAFNIEPYSRAERLFRVGCEQEDNRVSLQEIEAVIDKFKK